MRPRRISLLLAAVILLIAVSCNKGGKSGLLVPKDAAIVFHVNSSSLTSKLSWTEITQTEWFKDGSSKATDTLALQILKDPSSSGIDTKEDFVVYIKKQGNGGYVAMTGTVKDAEAFKAFNVKASK